MSKQAFEALLGQYWDLAYLEGNSGVSQGDKANEVLYALKKLAAQPLSQARPVTAITRYELLKMARAAGLEEEFVVDPQSEQRFRLFTQIAVSALAEQPAQQEPVAWMRTSGTGSPVVTEALLVEMPEMRWNFKQPLYTTPPQRKPLTDQQIVDLCDGTLTTWEQVRIARAIEAAHGIKVDA